VTEAFSATPPASTCVFEVGFFEQWGQGRAVRRVVEIAEQDDVLQHSAHRAEARLIIAMRVIIVTFEMSST
jgi:hypothetical protein